jgi:hypothetical protein
VAVTEVHQKVAVIAYGDPQSDHPAMTNDWFVFAIRFPLVLDEIDDITGGVLSNLYIPENPVNGAIGGVGEGGLVSFPAPSIATT